MWTEENNTEVKINATHTFFVSCCICFCIIPRNTHSSAKAGTSATTINANINSLTPDKFNIFCNNSLILSSDAKTHSGKGMSWFKYAEVATNGMQLMKNKMKIPKCSRDKV